MYVMSVCLCYLCVDVCVCISCILTSGPFISVFFIVIIWQRGSIGVRSRDGLKVGVFYSPEPLFIVSYSFCRWFYENIAGTHVNSAAAHWSADGSTLMRHCVTRWRHHAEASAAPRCLPLSHWECAIL